MKELENSISDWHLAKFGTRSVDPFTTQLKLAEEAGEVARAMRRDDAKNAVDELGDVGIVLSCLARFYGTTLEKAMATKLVELNNRLKR